MAPGSRFERAPGENEEKYRHLTILARNEAGLPEPPAAGHRRPPRGLLPPAPDRQGAPGRARRGADRALRVPGVGDAQPAAGGSARAKADEVARRTADIFGAGNFYLELQDHGLPEQRQPEPHAGRARRPRPASRWWRRTTSTTRTRADAKPHDVLLCIQQQKVQTDTNRLKFDTDEFYLKTAEEMRAVFAAVPRGLRRDARRSPSRASSTLSEFGASSTCRGSSRRQGRTAGRATCASSCMEGRRGAVRRRSPDRHRGPHRARARRHRVDGLRRATS